MSSVCAVMNPIVPIVLMGILFAGNVGWAQQTTARGEESSRATNRQRSGPAMGDTTQAQTLQVRKSGDDHLRLIYHASALPVVELQATVKQLLSAEGQLPASSVTETDGLSLMPVALAASVVSNSLVVSGPPAAVKEIEELLRGLDQHMGQVLVEVEIGEASAVTAPATTADQPRDGTSRWGERPADIKTLGRVQLTTLNNNPAFVQLGARVPMAVGTSKGTTNESGNAQLQNVGLLVGCTPRITPDGKIVMEIDVEKSEVSSRADGESTAVSGDGTGNTSHIKTSTVQTTVTVADGETIVLGSVAQQGKNHTSLVVVLTSHIVRPGQQPPRPTGQTSP